MVYVFHYVIFGKLFLIIRVAFNLCNQLAHRPDNLRKRSWCMYNLIVFYCNIKIFYLLVHLAVKPQIYQLSRYLIHNINYLDIWYFFVVTLRQYNLIYSITFFTFDPLASLLQRQKNPVPQHWVKNWVETC